MELTKEQTEALARGAAIPLTIADQQCVLVRKDVYDQVEPEYDAGPWTREEIDLLADEAERIITQSEETPSQS